MSRAQETPQQTKQRQQMDKMKTSQTRLAKKTKVETIDGAMNNFKSEVKKQPVITSVHHVTDCYGGKVSRSSQLRNIIK